MLALRIPAYSFGQTDFLCSTIHDCDEWETGQSLNCDGLIGAGNWNCDPGGNKEQITSDANYSAGGGGRGQRHWVPHWSNIFLLSDRNNDVSGMGYRQASILN